MRRAVIAATISPAAREAKKVEVAKSKARTFEEDLAKDVFFDYHRL